MFPIKKQSGLTPSDLEDLVAVTGEQEFDEAALKVVSMVLSNTPWLQGGQLKRTPIPQLTMLHCQVESCPYYSVCPVMAALSESKQEELRGTLCRADKIYALGLAVSLVREYNIQPQDTTSLVILNNMVRLHVLIRRIQWQIDAEGGAVLKDVPLFPNNRTGEVVFGKAEHPLFNTMLKLQKQLDSYHKQFVATVSEKLKLATQLGGGKDFLRDLFTGKKVLPGQQQALQAEYRDVPLDEET